MSDTISDEPGQVDAILAYGRGKVAKALSWAGAPFHESFPVSLTVISGNHSGCSAEIDESRFSIGSDPDHDIMLTDADAAGPLVVLTARRTVLGRVLSVQAKRDDVKLNNIRLVDGMGCDMLPCTLSVGTVDLRIEAAQGAKKSAFTFEDLRLIAGLILVGIIMLTLPSWMPSDPDTVQRKMDTVTVAQPELIVGVDLNDMLAEKISNAGLTEYIASQAGPDDTVTITGTIPSSLMTQWRGLLADIDTELYASRIIVNVKQASELGNLPAITIVELGSEPNLMLASGASLQVGDELVDDWIISIIGIDSVTLSRAGEVIEVMY